MKQIDFVQTSGAAGSGADVGLPLDLQHEAVRRVALLASWAAVAATVVLFVPWALPSFGLIDPIARAVVIVPFVVVAAAIAVVAFRARLPPARILDLGLVLQVVGIAVIAVAAAPRHWPTGPIVPMWPPAAVFLLIGPLIVPSTTRRTAITAVACACADALTILALVKLGLVDEPSPVTAAVRLGATCAAVPLSIVVSRLVHRLGAAVRAAREMGSYRLVERLGAGGMGEVWRAQHRMLSRNAAVKLIRREMLAGTHDPSAGERVRERFDREAQTIASLRSPHTVQLYDYGSTGEGTLYLVMELLDGLDLETLVANEGPLPAERVVHVLRQACHSLGEAHRAGLVHRDVKPANLFLCRYGEGVDHVKVLDFGLVGHQAAAARTGLSDGTIVGTPAYLAPENVIGDTPLDGRADLYALGCVAYFLLTGQTVFAAQSVREMAIAHAKASPEPPSERTELAVPDALETIVMACLAKAPDDRPASARALSDALAKVELDDEWTEDRARRWWESRGHTT